MSFMDQMLDRLAGMDWHYFLDEFLGYNHTSIALEYQEKITFTCPYGNFEFNRMSFGLCITPTTFERFMILIFSDIVKDTIEVFIYDVLVFGDSFDNCLAHLANALQKCTECNLVLNWEKNAILW